MPLRLENCEIESSATVECWMCGDETSRTGFRLRDFLEPEPASEWTSVMYALLTAPMFRWYPGSGCRRIWRVARMKARVAKMQPSMQAKRTMESLSETSQTSHHPTDYRQRIRPTNAAQSNFKAVCVGTANLSKFIRVPTKRKTHAGDNHRNRWNGQQWIFLLVFLSIEQRLKL